MGLFKKIYNQANNLNMEEAKNICDTIYVSFLDVLKEKTIKRKVYQNSSCLCMEQNNISYYYDKCPKCHGKKELDLLGKTVLCNCCKGTGKTVKEVCPICQGTTKTLKKVEMEIKLSKSLLENPILTIIGKGINQGNLVLNVNIYDKDFYLIKDDNVYSKKIIHFSKKEFKSSKEVETAVDVSNIKLDKIIYQQVLVLKGKGLNGKDFYQPVECEVEGSKGVNVYTNLLLEEKYEGIYIHKQDIYNQNAVLNHVLAKPLNDPNYIYLDLKDLNKNYDIIAFPCLGLDSSDGGENGDLIVKIFLGKYFVKDNNLYRTDEQLTKTEITSHKKSIIIDNEKHLVNMEKEKKENYFLYMGKFGLLNKDNKQGDFYTLINHSYSVYRVSTFNKSNQFFIEDYKHFFDEKVLSYQTNNNMNDYIEVNGNKNPQEIEDKYGNKVIVSLIKKEGL